MGGSPQSAGWSVLCSRRAQPAENKGHGPGNGMGHGVRTDKGHGPC